MKTPASLTDAEIEILKRGRSDPNIVTNYFFRPFGGTKGYLFDENFDPAGAWQKSFMMMRQRNGIVSGGVGTGKTSAIGMGAVWLALVTHPDFKFMNVAPTANQAQYMYEYIMGMVEGTPIERLIWSSPEKPYPKIEFKFKVYDTIVTSTLFFMSVDKNAKNIFSFEGDWINIDEAAMIENLEKVIVSIGSRLRGSYRGRERMGRLTMTSNPWDNPYFWYLFDLAQADTVNNLSVVVSTRHNHNVTEAQLAQILQRIPKNEWAQFIDGGRPEGMGNYFNKASIYSCEDEEWGAEIEAMVLNKIDGYDLHRFMGTGVNFYRVPPKNEDTYILVGDPGTDAAPKRNAPAIALFRVSNFPTDRADMVSCWWGDGNGSIAPFVQKMCWYIEKYAPIISAIDSTSTQKNMAETINALVSQVDDDGYSNMLGVKFKLPVGTKIKGLDFSGAKKAAYLVSTQFLIEAQLLRWPKFMVGLRSQLSNYDPLLDKSTSGAGKIPQDLVAMLSMACWVIRRWFYVDLEKENGENTDEDEQLVSRNQRSVRIGRSPRSRRAFDRLGNGPISIEEYPQEDKERVIEAM